MVLKFFGGKKLSGMGEGGGRQGFFLFRCIQEWFSSFFGEKNIWHGRMVSADKGWHFLFCHQKMSDVFWGGGKASVMGEDGGRQGSTMFFTQKKLSGCWKDQKHGCGVRGGWCKHGVNCIVGGVYFGRNRRRNRRERGAPVRSNINTYI